MRRNATLATPTAPVALTPAQVAALGALLSGASVTAAAEAADCDRGTVYRWLKQPEFLAAYNHGRQDLLAASQTRLLALADRAVAVVERAIDQDADAKTALSLLRGLGVLSSVVVGATDVQAIADEQLAVQANAASHRSTNRELAALYGADI